VTVPTTRVARGARDVAEAAGEHVGRLMVEVEERLATIAAGDGPALAAHAGATIAAGGKRLRPLLVFLCAGGPPGDPQALVRAAVAVELIHSATLVHDDVLDAAELRRGRPTVVAAAGRDVATATGDMLFARAFSEVAAGGRVEQVRILSSASSALARGELLQRADAWDVAVRVERYLERCELKTASLFAAAAELGALEGSAPAAELAEFGRRIGLAFQLLDDVLDVSGPPERTGKRRGTDLLDGTVTLPFIIARERDSSLAGLDLAAAVRSPGQAEALCDRIAATGALDEAKERALRLAGEAKERLPTSLTARQRLTLELVADGVVERYA
jgi:geranylgeranyl pyrophosphate synthase